MPFRRAFRMGQELVSRLLGAIDKGLDRKTYQELHWEGTFEDYLKVIAENPRCARNAFQRVYDMILSYGAEEYTENREPYVRYHFFRDPMGGGRDSIFGLEESLSHLVNAFKSAAHGYGTERRIILLHGPVGSSKSTIVRLLKKGLEAYSRTRDGALYTFAWKDEGEGDSWSECPMHEDPLRLIPPEVRESLLKELNKTVSAGGYEIRIPGEVCPSCRRNYTDAMKKARGDWREVMRRIKVRRMVLSEKDRVGIGTFQPKDEKNQDSTELTGDINYRKIAEFGSDSDPRAFNFDGEFNVANRGIIEFIEVLKLDVAFLYDLLGASQEHKIKPKKFSQTDIDEVIIGHTNEPEYRKLQSNEFMEALRDRTVKIDVPYITRLKDETRIYERDFNRETIRNTHIAPHTLEMAALWAVLTRLEEPKKASINLVQKLRLYNGQSLPGFTEENVKELRRETVREGLDGISPRYIQDKISNALVSDEADRCVNPFMVLNELESGLQHHSLINSEELRKRYRELLAQVKEEYEDLVKNEVQRAISADED